MASAVAGHLQCTESETPTVRTLLTLSVPLSVSLSVALGCVPSITRVICTQGGLSPCGTSDSGFIQRRGQRTRKATFKWAWVDPLRRGDRRPARMIRISTSVVAGHCQCTESETPTVRTLLTLSVPLSVSLSVVLPLVLSITSFICTQGGLSPCGTSDSGLTQG